MFNLRRNCMILKVIFGKCHFPVGGTRLNAECTHVGFSDDDYFMEFKAVSEGIECKICGIQGFDHCSSRNKGEIREELGVTQVK